MSIRRAFSYKTRFIPLDRGRSSTGCCTSHRGSAKGMGSALNRIHTPFCNLHQFRKGVICGESRLRLVRTTRNEGRLDRRRAHRLTNRSAADRPSYPMNRLRRVIAVHRQDSHSSSWNLSYRQMSPLSSLKSSPISSSVTMKSDPSSSPSFLYHSK